MGVEMLLEVGKTRSYTLTRSGLFRGHGDHSAGGTLPDLTHLKLLQTFTDG